MVWGMDGMGDMIIIFWAAFQIEQYLIIFVMSLCHVWKSSLKKYDDTLW
jgi:hypothetical protein